MFCKSTYQNTNQFKLTHSPCQSANQCKLTLKSQHFTYFLALRNSINLENKSRIYSTTLPKTLSIFMLLPTLCKTL